MDKPSCHCRNVSFRRDQEKAIAELAIAEDRTFSAMLRIIIAAGLGALEEQAA